MLICRCAWHTRYYGYPRWTSVVSWRGVALRFTDGICAYCARRFRAEHRHLLERRATATKKPLEAPATSAVA